MERPYITRYEIDEDTIMLTSTVKLIDTRTNKKYSDVIINKKDERYFILDWNEEDKTLNEDTSNEEDID